MTPIPMPALRISALLAALLLALSAPARGQTATCPVDGAPVPVTPTPTWNQAGGCDSDGCRWSIDAQDHWRIVGLDEVVSCPRCLATFRFDHLASLKLGTFERDRVMAATAAAARAGARPDDPVGRYLLAAATYEALGPEQLALLGYPAPQALLGELYLRGAWAARGQAVLPGLDPAYRPRDLVQAQQQLAELEARLTQDRERRSGVGEILVEVERLRAQAVELEKLPGVGAHVAADRLTESLMELEQRLYRLLRDNPDLQESSGEQASARGYLSMVRALVRFGDPTRRDAWLTAARDRFGVVVEQQARTIRTACAREAELLGLAQQAFLAAAGQASDPPEQARLRFLAGDAARRRGQTAVAAGQLKLAARLAPRSRAGRSAAALAALLRVD